MFLTIRVPYLPGFAGKLFSVQSEHGALGSFRMPETKPHSGETICLTMQETACPCFAGQLFAQNYNAQAECVLHTGHGFASFPVHFYPAQAWNIRPFLPYVTQAAQTVC